MSELVREELVRFGNKFLSYAKFVFGGMILSTVFFFIYAGVRADYIQIELLAAVAATFGLLLALAFIFVTFRVPNFLNPLKTSEKVSAEILELVGLVSKLEDLVRLGQIQEEEARILRETINKAITKPVHPKPKNNLLAQYSREIQCHRMNHLVKTVSTADMMSLLVSTWVRRTMYIYYGNNFYDETRDLYIGEEKDVRQKEPRYDKVP